MKKSLILSKLTYLVVFFFIFNLSIDAQVTVDQNKNVLVGDGNPTSGYKFTVNGNTDQNGLITYNETSHTFKWSVGTASTSGSFIFSQTALTNLRNDFVINRSNDITGISLDDKLFVDGAGNFKLGSTTSNGSFNFKNNIGTLLMEIKNNKEVNISQGGKLGIGWSGTLQSSLSVNGHFRLGGEQDIESNVGSSVGSELIITNEHPLKRFYFGNGTGYSL